MRIAVYPGSFDPVTKGHQNIIERAAAIFDKVYVCVMVNHAKTPTFPTDMRVNFIERCTSHLDNVVAESSDDLLVNYAKSRNATVIVKGLRALSDFEMEFQMAMANRKLEPTIDTVFLTAGEEYTYLSSSIVREMARYDADLTPFLPEEIIDDVKRTMHDVTYSQKKKG